MTKYAYIAISYQHRHRYSPFIESLKDVLKKYDWETSIPAYDLAHLPAADHHQIMEESFARLSSASLLIAEASEKNIGIGIEVGFARASHIPIIYLFEKGAELSTTVAGTANLIINYSSPHDVVTQLEPYLANQIELAVTSRREAA